MTTVDKILNSIDQDHVCQKTTLVVKTVEYDENMIRNQLIENE